MYNSTTTLVKESLSILSSVMIGSSVIVESSAVVRDSVMVGGPTVVVVSIVAGGSVGWQSSCFKHVSCLCDCVCTWCIQYNWWKVHNKVLSKEKFTYNYDSKIGEMAAVAENNSILAIAGILHATIRSPVLKIKVPKYAPLWTKCCELKIKIC